MTPITAALVLRPEPGNAATCARLAAAGVRATGVPLFAVEPVAWRVPEPGRYDALLLTSANAARHAGAGLARLAAMPVIAVGSATAAAARAAGLGVAIVGTGDAADALAAARHAGLGSRILHLAGRHRVTLPGVEAVTVYRSAPCAAVLPDLAGMVALLHSPRAAARFAALVAPDARRDVAIAALSATVAAAAGTGWRRATAIEVPDDAALVALAVSMIDRSAIGSDKPEP